ncbi:MAG: FkbM family methyltransferase [Sphingobacteriia bacterium]|nr:FkbM family methyltransferase [Sphingobacteriia bacterium]
MFLGTELNALINNNLFKETSVYKEFKTLPLGFVDIGARGGTHDIIEPIAGITSVLGFEADEEECKRLMSLPEVVNNWSEFKLEPIALYDKEGEVDLHLLSASTNHSLLSPNPVFIERYNMVKWHEVGKCTLKATTLDKILENNQKTNIAEFIKIDTQGTEYEIFQGSLNTLTNKTSVIITEVAFCELYKGQKLFSEVEMLLRSLGFSFYGFMPIRTRAKKLLDKKDHVSMERAFYTDAVFFKDPLDKKLNKQLNDRDVKVVFMAALLIGYYDFALELASSTWAKNDSNEQAIIRKLIDELSSIQPVTTIEALNSLNAQVNKTPEYANVLVGNFVDRRRKFNDYDDILNISPLPKTV